MRLLIQHRSHYGYPTPASLGRHLIRLRPTTHTKANVESYALHVTPAATIRWQQDPQGNRVAAVMFDEGPPSKELDVLVELAVEVRPVNPFDFFLDELAKNAPFDYPEDLRAALGPAFDLEAACIEGGPLMSAFLAEMPSTGDTVDLIVELNRLVHERIKYVIREEPGLWTPEQTLTAGKGSCRDSALVLMSALRSRGLAARFVSGYLVQLTDEGMIPNAPRGVSHDFTDLHAWAEVYLPGAGWVGLDATSGLLCGEGHIPLAATSIPELASPIQGTSNVAADALTFSMTVGRLGHEPRPTRPYEEEVWEELGRAGDRVDEELMRAGVRLTMGGEPTFNARDHAEEPEWNAEALGPTKIEQGTSPRRRASKALLARVCRHPSQREVVPGESLPRWALDICGRRDGAPLWTDAPAAPRPADLAAARRFAERLAARVGHSKQLLAAYEDPWHYLREEERLPVGVDPLKADLKAAEERRRLAALLDRGLGQEAGFVLPLMREPGDTAWKSETWAFRRERLYLVPGDSSIGLRLPLQSLVAAKMPEPVEAQLILPDPRRPKPKKEDADEKRYAAGAPRPVRTAVCIEARDGRVRVFLPPFTAADDFFALVADIDAVRRETEIDAQLEGYPPPSDPRIFKLTVTPDPGVLEVNLPPTERLRDHTAMMETVFDAALHAGLHTEKYQLDGRLAGSGGGHHLTFGGNTVHESPFLARPDLLASLITFIQHHPSLSFLFTGLFVGPTSQAPRPDEARHDSLYEMEIAFERAFAKSSEPPPPWLSDMLFRNLLVDLTGNTHRSEICIDKLFDPNSPQGRQGLVELRAFEMPPHARMATAQMVLMRALMASFAKKPYQGKLVRWGQALHDRFLLPHWMWRDFVDVLGHLESHGLGLPEDAYRPFVELRCPVVGAVGADGVTMEVRNAIEPWNVLGEEMSTSGTSRYVDSSMERIEVRATGLVPERHAILVNGYVLPMRETGFSGESVGGVKFRAWAPPHSLHAHIGIHHPLRLDLLDTWSRRSLAACGYHVWHPAGRGYDKAPLTRFEASARRAQRFTIEGPLAWPVKAPVAKAHPDTPYTLDLRRYPVDRPPPEPDADEKETP